MCESCRPEDEEPRVAFVVTPRVSAEKMAEAEVYGFEVQHWVDNLSPKEMAMLRAVISGCIQDEFHQPSFLYGLLTGRLQFEFRVDPRTGEPARVQREK